MEEGGRSEGGVSGGMSEWRDGYKGVEEGEIWKVFVHTYHQEYMGNQRQRREHTDPDHTSYILPFS